MRRTLMSLLVLAACATCVSGQAAKKTPESKEMVKKVFDAWKERRARFKSVRYRASGTVFIPRGSIVIGQEAGGSGEPEPLEDLTLSRERDLLIDFATNRHRMEGKEQVYITGSGRNAEWRKGVSAHDGKQLWGSSPPGADLERRPGYPDALIMVGNLRESAFDSSEWAYFVAHGIVPMHDAHIIPGRLAPKLNEREFYHHGTAIHEGRECVILRTELDHVTGTTFNEYWVDFARGGLVLRQGSFVNNVAVINLDLRYQELPVGWLLAGWTLSVFRGGKTVRLHEMNVGSVEANVGVTNDNFKLVLAPGMKVTKLHRGGNEDSIAPAPTLSDQQFVVDQSGRLVQTGGTPEPRGYFWWIVAGCSVPLLILMALWLRRRRSAA